MRTKVLDLFHVDRGQGPFPVVTGPGYTGVYQTLLRAEDDCFRLNHVALMGWQTCQEEVARMVRDFANNEGRFATVAHNATELRELALLIERE